MFPGCSVAQVQGCVPKTTNESKGERTCESHCWPWETQRWASRASCINRIIYCSHRDTLLFSQDQRKCIKYWIRVCTGIAYCWFSPSMVITKCVNPKNHLANLHKLIWYCGFQHTSFCSCLLKKSWYLRQMQRPPEIRLKFGPSMNI
jgi:hypothetical protein